MTNRNLFLIVCLVFVAFVDIISTKSLYAFSSKKEDVYSVYFKMNRPGRFYAAPKDDTTISPEVYNGYGGGISINSVRVDYIQYFRGNKVSLSYDFTPEGPISIYTGLSYVWGTKSRITFTSGSQLLVDRSDLFLGVSANLFRGYITHVNPYVDYSFLLNAVNMGVRFHIYIG